MANERNSGGEERISVYLTLPEFFKLSEDESDDLFRGLEGAVPGSKAEWAPVGGLGWVETVNIVVGSIATAHTIVAPMVKWMRKRFKTSPHPKQVRILYGPDHKVLKVVQLLSEHDEPDEFGIEE